MQLKSNRLKSCKELCEMYGNKSCSEFCSERRRVVAIGLQLIDREVVTYF